MPITDPGTGGIVTVPDPITGGAGAAVTTTEVINAMWKMAAAKSSSAVGALNDGIAEADPAPHMLAAYLDQTYLQPVKPSLPDNNPNDAEAMFNTQRDQMINLVVGKFDSFITEWFPRPEWYEDALAWCDKAVVEGGSGMNPAVESALWERGRARILSDSGRAEDEAMSTWANRRFPLPPGPLTNQINEIRLDASRKLAEQSRDISAKVFDVEIENVRFAVTKLLDQRKIALDAAGDYVKTLMQAPSIAMQLATGLAGIRTDLARALVGLYSAEVAAAEPRIRLAITDAQLRQGASEANLRSDNAAMDAKIRAFIAAAQLLAQQASAGINAINAQTSISGQDGTSN